MCVGYLAPDLEQTVRLRGLKGYFCIFTWDSQACNACYAQFILQPLPLHFVLQILYITVKYVVYCKVLTYQKCNQCTSAVCWLWLDKLASDMIRHGKSIYVTVWFMICTSSISGLKNI